MNRALLMSLCCVLLAPPVMPDARVEYVSMIRLIASPETFDGKIVSTIGFLRLGTEEDTLFVNSEDSLHDIMDNAVWVGPDTSIHEHRQLLDGNYVLLTGVFSSKPRGTIEGGFSEITRSELWSDMKHPRYLEKKAEWGTGVQR